MLDQADKLWRELSRKRWLWPVLLASLLLPSLFLARRSDLIGRWWPPAGQAAVQARSAPELVEVRRGSMSKRLLLDGELRAVRSRTIFANTTEEAKIVFLPPEGTLVRAGDRLVEL